MGLWTRVPRGMRDRVTGVLPNWWWTWLHQVREIDVDREWQGAAILRSAYPSLTGSTTAVDALRAAEVRVHSQNGEDGILSYLLGRIGPATRDVVEFGVGDGTECCAANLVLTFGWSAHLLEANSADAAAAAAFYAERAGDRVHVDHTAVEPDTVDALVSRHVASVFDVLSLDIDGNDYWVLDALEAVRPRVIVVEYNATFGPERVGHDSVHARVRPVPGARVRLLPRGVAHGARTPRRAEGLRARRLRLARDERVPRRRRGRRGRGRRGEPDRGVRAALRARAPARRRAVPADPHLPLVEV